MPEFVLSGRCTVVLVGAEWDGASHRLRARIPRALPSQSVDFVYIDVDEPGWEAWLMRTGVLSTPTVMAWSGGRLLGSHIGPAGVIEWIGEKLRAADDMRRGPGTQRLAACGLWTG